MSKFDVQDNSLKVIRIIAGLKPVNLIGNIKAMITARSVSGVVVALWKTLELYLSELMVNAEMLTSWFGMIIDVVRGWTTGKVQKLEFGCGVDAPVPVDGLPEEPPEITWAGIKEGIGKFFSTMSQTTLGTAAATLGGVGLVACGFLSSTFKPMFSFWDSLAKLAKSLTTVTTISAKMGVVIDGIKTMCLSLCGWGADAGVQAHYTALQAIHEWCDKTKLAMLQCSRVCTPRDYEFHHNKLNILRRRINCNPETPKTLVRYLQKADNKMEEIQQGLLALASSVGARRRPVMVVLHGAPGGGKTNFARNIVKELGMESYTHAPGLDHWDNYHGEQAIIFDDPGVEDTNELKKLQGYADTAPTTLNCDLIQNKGKLFAPELIIVTTNLPCLLAPFTEPAAMARRIDYGVLVENHLLDAYHAGGGLDYPANCYAADFSHLTLTGLPPMYTDTTGTTLYGTVQTRGTTKGGLLRSVKKRLARYTAEYETLCKAAGFEWLQPQKLEDGVGSIYVLTGTGGCGKTHMSNSVETEWKLDDYGMDGNPHSLPKLVGRHATAGASSPIIVTVNPTNWKKMMGMLEPDIRAAMTRRAQFFVFKFKKNGPFSRYTTKHWDLGERIVSISCDGQKYAYADLLEKLSTDCVAKVTSSLSFVPRLKAQRLDRTLFLNQAVTEPFSLRMKVQAEGFDESEVMALIPAMMKMPRTMATRTLEGFCLFCNNYTGIFPAFEATRVCFAEGNLIMSHVNGRLFAAVEGLETNFIVNGDGAFELRPIDGCFPGNHDANTVVDDTCSLELIPDKDTGDFTKVVVGAIVIALTSAVMIGLDLFDGAVEPAEVLESNHRLSDKEYAELVRRGDLKMKGANSRMFFIDPDFHKANKVVEFDPEEEYEQRMRQAREPRGEDRERRTYNANNRPAESADWEVADVVVGRQVYQNANPVKIVELKLGNHVVGHGITSGSWVLCNKHVAQCANSVGGFPFHQYRELVGTDIVGIPYMKNPELKFGGLIYGGMPVWLQTADDKMQDGKLADDIPQLVKFSDRTLPLRAYTGVKTGPGCCGSPILAVVKGVTRVIGLHTSSDGTKAMMSFIPSHVHELLARQSLEVGGGLTSMWTSPLGSGKPLKVPSILGSGDPRNPENLRGFALCREQFKNFTAESDSKFDEKDVDAVASYLAGWACEAPVLSPLGALAHMELDSSAGLEAAQLGIGSKSDLYFRTPEGQVVVRPGKQGVIDQLVKLHEKVLSGENPVRMSAFLKEEALPIEKVENCISRAVTCAGVIATTRMGQFAGGFFRALKRVAVESGIAVGINPHGPDWGHLAERLGKNVFDLDFSKWDSTLGGQEVEAADRVIARAIDLCGGQGDKYFANAKTVHLPEVTMDGECVQYKRGMPSGRNGTSQVNCIVHLLCLSETARKLGTTLDQLVDSHPFSCYGDDFIMSANHPDSPKILSALVKTHEEHGHRPTNPQKTGKPSIVPLENASYLSRRFVWENGMWLCPLKLESVWGILEFVRIQKRHMWAADKDSIPTVPGFILRQLCDAFLMEAAAHGEVFYRDACKELFRRRTAAGIVFHVNVPSWAGWFNPSQFAVQTLEMDKPTNDHVTPASAPGIPEGEANASFGLAQTAGAAEATGFTASNNGIDPGIMEHFVASSRGNFTVSSNNLNGTIILNLPMEPKINPYLALLSQMYNAWAGGWDVQIILAANSFTSGKLIIACVPPWQERIDFTAEDLTAFPNVLIDIREMNAIVVGFPDIKSQLFHRMADKTPDGRSGTLMIGVLNRLRGASDEVYTIEGRILTRPGPDFSFSFLVPPTNNVVEVAGYAELEAVLNIEQPMGASSGMQVNTLLRKPGAILINKGTTPLVGVNGHYTFGSTPVQLSRFKCKVMHKTNAKLYRIAFIEPITGDEMTKEEVLQIFPYKTVRGSDRVDVYQGPDQWAGAILSDETTTNLTVITCDTDLTFKVGDFFVLSGSLAPWNTTPDNDVTLPYNECFICFTDIDQPADNVSLTTAQLNAHFLEHPYEGQCLLLGVIQNGVTLMQIKLYADGWMSGPSTSDNIFYPLAELKFYVIGIVSRNYQLEPAVGGGVSQRDLDFEKLVLALAGTAIAQDASGSVGVLLDNFVSGKPRFAGARKSRAATGDQVGLPEGCRLPWGSDESGRKARDGSRSSLRRGRSGSAQTGFLPLQPRGVSKPAFYGTRPLDQPKCVWGYAEDEAQESDARDSD